MLAIQFMLAFADMLISPLMLGLYARRLAKANAGAALHAVVAIRHCEEAKLTRQSIFSLRYQGGLLR
jgi:hypothetical protein